MKVMVAQPSGGAYYYIANSFINAFKDIGVNAVFWDGNKEKFLEFKPDLYIGCSGHRKEAPKATWFKIAIHVNPYGDRLDPINGVDINESKDAIDWTLRQNPDVVFGYGLDEDGKTFWKNWPVKFVGVPTAGDVTLYYPSNEKSDNYQVAYFGGRWGYKGHNIDKWLLPAIKKLGVNIDIKGWGGWQGVRQYSGTVPENDSGCDFLNKALVGPCICEPHTTVYGIDVPERFFKVALCGVLPILDTVSGFDRYCDMYIMAKDPDEYYNMILNYAKNPDYVNEGKEIAKEIRKEILRKHTYHHRMRNVCISLGFDEIAEKFDEKIKNFS